LLSSNKLALRFNLDSLLKPSVAVRLMIFPLAPRLTRMGGRSEEEVGEVSSAALGSRFIELSKGDNLFELLKMLPLTGFIGTRFIKEVLLALLPPTVLLSGVLLCKCGFGESLLIMLLIAMREGYIPSIPVEADPFV
jgi:hypothetical protein